MGEFMTQPLTGADALLLVAATIFTWTFFLWLVGFLWYKRDAEKRIDGLETALGKKLSNGIFESYRDYWNSRIESLNTSADDLAMTIGETKAQVRDLDETVESISDTLWAIEDDVDALQRPAWKKLLRKLSE